MKFTLSWLKDHLETEAGVEQIAAALVGVGLEVEEVSDRAQALQPFKVGYVMEAIKHPNADKLTLCQVETDEGVKQVVCGAPNARSGIKGIVALPGAYIPGTGVTLEKGVIRGQESQAMLCSERELQISDAHTGIIEVEDHWPVGTPAAVALGLSDPMFYIKVTPNRPDALGIRGIARDLAAKGLGRLKPLQADAVAGTFPSPIKVRLAFASGDTTPCPLFVGRYFCGVKNGPSPQWLQHRLRAIGLRPISALVDITNYITFSYGRPLHVFDADKVKGDIHARLAMPGETIDGLDGKTYTLTGEMTVIADDQAAEGIAGILGGTVTACDDATTNVFLEAAYFDPLRTAATGRKLGINSDARYRFERGVDPGFVTAGAEIATRMILDLCGGEASDLVIAGVAPDATRSYTLRGTRVKTLGGIEIPMSEQARILRDLGFAVSETAEGLICLVPSWRPDIRGEADLVEEVCRIVGLEQVPAAAMERPHAIARPILTPLQKRMLAARRTLAARGFNEAITWAFLPAAHANAFGGGGASLKLANPISSELTDMRPSLLANLVAAAARNQARGFADFAISEIGHAYAGDRPEDETLRAAGIRQGDAVPRQWQGSARPVDAFDAKADALAILEAAGIAAATLQVTASAPSWFHPGRSGSIQMGAANALGHFGELHPRILADLDCRGPVAGFEIILDRIPVPRARGTAKAALASSDLMAVTRDFAFVVDDKIVAADLVKAARGADRALIADASVFDVFKLGDGQTSLALAVTLQPRDKTLTDAEIEALSAKIVAAAGKAVGAKLRS